MRPAGPDQTARLLAGVHPAPHRYLGRRRGEPVVRALLPGAVHAELVEADGRPTPMRRVDGPLFDCAVVDPDAEPGHRLRVGYADGATCDVDDPYLVGPRLTDDDRHRIRDGDPHRLWDLLGSHPAASGVHFAVWAPNARGVTVFGDFDAWGAQSFPMTRRDGVWEVFVPGAAVGDRYKYRIVGADGIVRDKADPLARRAQTPPDTASIVDGPSRFVWTDEHWVAARGARRPGSEPMSVYEVHLGSWRPGLDYRTAARLLADHVVEQNFTHVQLLPITEHPYAPSWGYQVGSYFAPTSRFGDPDDVRAFVDHLHSRGVGVILDWVPAHFPKDEFALGEFDGTPLYEHADPLRREQPDWGTFAFNLGRDEVRAFLLAAARYWCEEFHLDGIRVDAVAAMLYLDYSRGPGQWRPNPDGGHHNHEAVAFLRALTDDLHAAVPGIVVIAEESTAWPGVTAATEDGGLGFDFKWDLGWMHETLGHLARPAADRGSGNVGLLRSLTAAGSERYVLPLSHDEMVHGKGTLTTRMPHGPGDDPVADVRLLLAYQWAHPGKKLLFMGQEFGQVDEWSEHRGIDWECLHGPDGAAHRGVARLVRDLGRLLRSTPALSTGDCRSDGLELLDASDTDNGVVVFLRRCPDGGDVIACLFNFGGTDLHDYRIGLPSPGRWREVLNTAAVDYLGSGLGNLGAVHAGDRPSHGRPYSAGVTLPARSSIWLIPETFPLPLAD